MYIAYEEKHNWQKLLAHFPYQVAINGMKLK